MASTTNIETKTIINNPDNEYVSQVSHISSLWWTIAKYEVIFSVNTSLLMANWETGRYTIEFEQEGLHRAKYDKFLLVNLSKDLTRLPEYYDGAYKYLTSLGLKEL